ncbi:MAG: ShlB/FhaC/HecB family hemolysin secretion/activation protein [Pseudomonadota bacterium]
MCTRLASHYLRRQFCLVIAAVLLCPGYLVAQTAPDAGSVLQQIEQQQRKPLPQQAAPMFVPPAPMQSLGGATVTVTEFRFAGNTLLASPQLALSVAKFVGRPIGFSELQDAAVAVADAYRQAGWVVRAYLPKQEITDGSVTIQIIEATFGAVHVEGGGTRVSAARLTNIITTAQTAGAPLNVRALDRGLLLINDLPGVLATGRLAPGRYQAESDLVIALEDGPAVSGNVTVDDAGSRFTGEERLIAAASLNGPLHIGDRADGLLLHSEGSDYQRVGYSLPVGSRGIRVGANASHLTYDIVTSDFTALDAHGTSDTVGLEASYPLLRSRLKNVYLGLNADDKQFDNSSAGITTTKYSAQTATLGLYANSFDSWLGGGSNTASLALVRGRIDLGGSPNESIDALTTRTAGSFNKVRYSLSRLQVLTDRFSMYANLSGQTASKNLDSSEKFYLGGPAGVRAYPQDEGSGSEGMLLNLEVRARLPANFGMTAFVDAGRVRINKDNDILGGVADNTADLKGGGLSASWTASFGLTLQATVSRRIGRNPNPTSTGEDQDGSLTMNRFWLQASMPF